MPVIGDEIRLRDTRGSTATCESAVGLGCAKTRACCGAVECGSQTPDVFASSREAHVTLPTDARRRNSAFPTLFVHGRHSSSCYHVSSASTIRRPQRNKILTVFAP
jgi:hypothetical protein